MGMGAHPTWIKQSELITDLSLVLIIESGSAFR